MIVWIAAVSAGIISGCHDGPASRERISVSRDSLVTLGEAFAQKRSDFFAEGEGAVLRILPDDLQGARHQRFVIKLASGQTLLISHNIDLAPRIDTLSVGDDVQFRGEYLWNQKGGLIHWTHHDPRHTIPGGWIWHEGELYK